MVKLFKFIAGVALGAVAGVAAGLLLAPASGSEAQGRIKARISEALEAGKRVAAQREAELEAEFEQARRGSSATG
jgi:gas vesicle protein